MCARVCVSPHNRVHGFQQLLKGALTSEAAPLWLSAYLAITVSGAILSCFVLFHGKWAACSLKRMTMSTSFPSKLAFPTLSQPFGAFCPGSAEPLKAKGSSRNGPAASGPNIQPRKGLGTKLFMVFSGPFRET